MTLGIGKLGLTVGGSGPVGAAVQIITATVEPAAEALFVGDTIGDITNIATLRNTANYASTAGTISSVVVRVDGVAQADGFTLSDGEAVTVFVTDSAANTRSWTIDGNVLDVPAANTAAPAVTGSTSLGDVLTATDGTWSGTGNVLTRQWQRGGVDISGETASTYTIVSADDAASVRCAVTATNSSGAVTANSNAVTVDDFAIPIITGVPTISGTTEQGQTLTATAAVVTGNPTPTRTWQWQRAGVAISGATASTYALVAADVGNTLTVVQTETNGIGADSAESAATGTITAVALSLSSITWTDGANGTAPSISFVHSYTGADTNLEMVVSLSNSGTAPSKAQMNAGTGGGVLGTAVIDLTGNTSVTTADAFTSAVDGATNVYAFLREKTGSEESDIQTDTTSAVDATDPAISSSDPADNSTDHPIADNIAITFNDSVFFGTGNIVLRENNGGWSDLETFDVVTEQGTGAGQVSISGAVLNINPTADLTAGREYAIRIAATCINDDWGNSFAGITDDTTLSFTAASAFAPTDLYTGGNEGTFLEFDDFNEMSQNEFEPGDGSATAVTATGQSIGWVNDYSGNGIDFLQATAANKPVVQGSAGARYLDIVTTGGHDFLETDNANTDFSTFTSDMTVMMRIRPTNGTIVGFATSNGLIAAGIGQSGSANAADLGVGSSVTYWIDNVEVDNGAGGAPQRQHLYTALNAEAGNDITFEIRGLDLSSMVTTEELRLFEYGGGFQEFVGRVYGWALFETPSASLLTDARTYMEGLS